MNIKNIFKQLGLKEEHAKVYLTNLERGESSITKLAVKSDIPRTTLYPIIEELVKTGLLVKILNKGKSNYQAAEPELLLTLLEKKQIEIAQSLKSVQSNLSELKAMQNSNKKKPKIEFLEGADGIK